MIIDPSKQDIIDAAMDLGAEGTVIAMPSEFHKYIELHIKPLLLTSISSDIQISMHKTETFTLQDEDPASVSTLIHNLIELAYTSNASDIQIIPFRDNANIYFRIDGKRRLMTSLDKKALSPLHRILGSLAFQQTDDERKLLQGKIDYQTADGILELRLNIIPTRLGPSINLRLHLQHDLDLYSITNDEDIHKLFKSITQLSSGLILFCGPTGSGKSTSMIALAKQLLAKDMNICDVEDPVEQLVPGINQVDIAPQKELTYSTVSKSFLRHDPDGIIIGEIRDLEVANVALQAAETGHIVLSTLHTKDSISTINRLLDLGVSRSSLADNLSIIISQRLIRSLCPNCKKKIEIKPGDKRLSLLASGKQEAFTCYQACGCEQCGGTGYKGRIAIFDYLIVTDDIKEIIIQKGSTSRIKTSNHKSLLEDALQKVREGLTTFEEIQPLVANEKLRTGELYEGW